MKRMKKWISLVLLVTMAMTLFSGCGGEQASEPAVESRTVVDATGREITVPGEI